MSTCLCGAWDCRSCYPGQPRAERERDDLDAERPDLAARDEATEHDVRMRMYDHLP
jgi:hypothetical protein